MDIKQQKQWQKERSERLRAHAHSRGKRSILDIPRSPRPYRCTITQYPGYSEANFFVLPGAQEELTIRTPTARGAYNKLMTRLHKQGISAPQIDFTWLSVDAEGRTTETEWAV